MNSLPKYAGMLFVGLVLLSASCATLDVEAERDQVLATLDSWNEGWETGDAALAVA